MGKGSTLAWTDRDLGEETEVMKCWTHPPLSQRMEEDIVWRAALVSMKLVK